VKKQAKFGVGISVIVASLGFLRGWAMEEQDLLPHDR